MRILLNLSLDLSRIISSITRVQRVPFRYYSIIPGTIVLQERRLNNVEHFVNAHITVSPSRSTTRYFSDFPLTDLVYERLSSSTLDELADYFEELPEFGKCPEEYDVQYGSGVLTIKVGGDIGTYVINKQSPNKQIWLSSPVSGPKRYDLIEGYWTYHHDNSVLHDLLSREFTEHLDSEVDLTKLENYHRLADGDAWS